MDLILGGFCDSEAARLQAAELDLLEAMMEENDQDLYQWVSGQAPVPERFAPMIDRIARHAGAR
jgi:antitoxin CptB